MVDLWFEPGLAKAWKIATSVVVFLIAAAFSWGIVFVSAPLGIIASVTDGDYPPGTNISGIVWRRGFTELRITLFNQSNHDYSNLSVFIQPTEPIAAITQSTNIPGVLFSDKWNRHFSVVDVNNGNGAQTALPLVIAATDAGYVIHCISLPAETSVDIEIALAEIRWPSPPSADRNFTLRIRYDDGSTFWLSYPNADVYVPQRPSTESVKFEGKYDAAFRTRTIDERVHVLGRIPPNLH